MLADRYGCTDVTQVAMYVGGCTDAHHNGFPSSTLGLYHGCGLGSQSLVCSLAGVVPCSVHVIVGPMSVIALGKFIFSRSK